MESVNKQTSGSRKYLVAGILASTTASICCIGPFALLATGLSGAWMSRVMMVEPFQPLLTGLTIAFFALAAWKIFYPAAGAKGDSCAIPKLGWQKKSAFFLTGLVAAVLLTSEYWIVIVA